MLIDIKPRRRQPQGWCRIDWSHPLARGLIGAWIFNGFNHGRWRDTARNQSLLTLTGSVLPATGLNGVAGNFGTGGNYFTVNTTFAPANSDSPLTVAALVFPTQVSTVATIVNYGEVTDFNATYSFAVNASGNLCQGNDGPTAENINSTLAVTANIWSFLAVSQAGTSSRIFQVNGTQQTNTATVSLIRGLTANLGLAAGFRNAAHVASSDWQGKIEYIFSWNRALSSAELLWFNAEPYAFISPVMARVTFRGTAGIPNRIYQTNFAPNRASFY